MEKRPQHYGHRSIDKERTSAHNSSDFEPAVSNNNIEIAATLLTVGSLIYYQDKPFELDSGILSPFYIDNRLILSNPNSRHVIVKRLMEELKEVGIPDVIAGVATGGIPYAAILAEKLDLPMVYVRPQPKTHGTQNQIEGQIKPGQIVVVIEDQISTAGSSTRVIKKLRDLGAVVNDEIAIITRATKLSKENLIKAEIKLHSLTDLNSLIKVALEVGFLNESQTEVISEWLKDPENWGK